MNKTLEEAEEIILNQCHTSSEFHFVISTENGCTGAIARMQQIIGTYMSSSTMSRLNSFREPRQACSAQKMTNQLNFLENMKSSMRINNQLPLVVISPYEHHSNEITWRMQLCDIEKVNFDDEGLMDYDHL